MSAAMSWFLLAIAGILEICWAICLKYSEGFTKPGASFFTILFLIASIILLAKASQALPIGTAYAVWVGIGAFGTAIVGIVLLKEPASIPRICFLLLLMVSIIGLKITAK